MFINENLTQRGHEQTRVPSSKGILGRALTLNIYSRKSRLQADTDLTPGRSLKLHFLRIPQLDAFPSLQKLRE